jgi:tetratricopeptide (TPR) repeat protein
MIAVKEEEFSESGSLRKAYEDFFGILSEYDVPWEQPGSDEESLAPKGAPAAASPSRMAQTPYTVARPWGGEKTQAARFRVALAFPGEFRLRVEGVAGALAESLGRGSVLYDRWYAAEFARPNLDSYLAELYLEHSGLVVVFLCGEYDPKQWVGIEWQSLRATLRRGAEDRLMLLRMDDARLLGISSSDGYVDISGRSDGDVAAIILERLGEPASAAARSYRAFISQLPVVNPTLIGREKELDFLDRAWGDPATNFVQVIAAGGTGKTALVDKWFRRHLGEATVFGWSFYSQGSSHDRQTSSDPFFAEIISWLDIKIAPTASVYAKAEAVARRLREERVLLLLDGVEPLQDPTGSLRDLPLKALLRELETANRGLVVCTTRVRIDIPDDAPRVLSIDLDNLTAEQGAEYLRYLKVEGTDEELQQASGEYWNHALALTLLGTYLVDFFEGDIRRRIEIPRLSADNAQAQLVIAAYERLFAGKPELDVLRALGYFDRPAEPPAVKLVLPTINDRVYRAALNRLFKARLILTTDPAQPLDCHRLVREHFAASATAEGHARLYEYYEKQAPQQPDTLEDMAPLFYAVYHGCRAGRHFETLDSVYRNRILRGNELYLVRKLGAFGIDLALLANFFEIPWTQPVAALPAFDQAWLIATAGSVLRAVGRLADAVEPIRAVSEIWVRSENWANTAISYSNLSELLLALGAVSEAVAAGRQSVDLADRLADRFRRIASRATLADALHQSGDSAEAKRLFEKSEQLQAESQPELPVLYSVWGYQYCDLLLGQGENAAVLSRAAVTLALAERHGRLLDVGLDHLSLGRAHASGSAEARYHLDQAVEFLRRAGQLDELPRALLARGTAQDLDEVFRMATRSGMRLYLADYHLAKGNIAEAEKLINETGYHRRDRELAALRARRSRQAD